MNKKIIKYLVFTLIVFCMFFTRNVNAETGCEEMSRDAAILNLTSAKLHDKNKTTYAPGEKVYVDIKAVTGSNIYISVMLRSGKNENGKYYNAYLKNTIGNPGEVISAYFIVPDDIVVGEEYEIWGYDYSLKSNDKLSCATFHTIKEEADSFGTNYLDDSYAKIKIVEKQEETKDILKSISVDETTAYFGGKYNFSFNTTEPISRIVLSFYNPVSPDGHNYGHFESYMFYSTNSATNYGGNVDVPAYGVNYVYPGTYQLNTIFIYDLDNNLIRYTTDKNFANSELGSGFLYYDGKINLKLEEPESNAIGEGEFIVNGMSFASSTLSVGEKLGVTTDFDYDTINERVKSVLLTYYDKSNNKMFSSYLKSLIHDPYIIVPSTASEGTYKLKSVVITIESINDNSLKQVIITNSDKVDYDYVFERTLTVTKAKTSEEGVDLLYFSADELDDNAFELIKNSKESSIITIYIDNSRIVPGEVFKYIKESQRQLIVESEGGEWVFNGTDIEELKPVDISIKYEDLQATGVGDELIDIIGGTSMALVFPDNGTLPGKALIRLKAEELNNKITGDNFYIYYYDKDGNKLDRVAMEVQKSDDGYVEFYVSHNSTYIISNKKIDDSSILGKDDEVMKINSPKENDKTTEEKTSKDNTVLYIAIGVGVVVLAGLVVLFVSSKNKSKKLKEMEEKIDSLTDKSDNDKI